MRTRHAGMSAEDLYKKCLPLLHHLAHKHAEPWAGATQEEMMSVASLSFAKAYNSMDWGRNGFSTYLYRIAQNDMISHLRKCKHVFHEMKGVDMDVYHGRHLPPDHFWSDDRLMSLSDEAREVIRIVLHVPEELLLCCPGAKPKHKRGAIRSHLMGRGWTASTIWNTFSEIKEFVRSGMGA